MALARISPHLESADTDNITALVSAAPHCLLTVPAAWEALGLCLSSWYISDPLWMGRCRPALSLQCARGFCDCLGGPSFGSSRSLSHLVWASYPSPTGTSRDHLRRITSRLNFFMVILIQGQLLAQTQANLPPLPSPSTPVFTPTCALLPPLQGSLGTLPCEALPPELQLESNRAQTQGSQSSLTSTN